MEDVRVGPITPAGGGVGYTVDQLKPAGADGVEILYVLSGAVAGEYAIVHLHTERPFRYEIVLRRRRRTP